MPNFVFDIGFVTEWYISFFGQTLCKNRQTILRVLCRNNMNCSFIWKKFWSDCLTVDLKTKKLKKQSRERNLYHLISKLDTFNLTDNGLNVFKRSKTTNMSQLILQIPQFSDADSGLLFSSTVTFSDGDHDDTLLSL